MVDPTLGDRLKVADLPVLVLWGESDRIVSADYGRAFASAFPNARFELLSGTGHVPQIETPDLVLASVLAFVSACGAEAQVPPGSGD
jgi:pimeloyl-ACP methyl ester carboxylesterase